MTMTNNIDYYTHRIAQERMRAERTDNVAARLVHEELAARYAHMLESQAAS